MWGLFGHKRDIKPTEALRKMKTGWKPFIIDVRTRGEANQSGVVKGTQLVHPHRKIAQKRKEIPKDRDVLVVCRSGNRSRTAIKKLEKLGFDVAQLHNLKGGIIGWARNGGDIVRPK